VFDDYKPSVPASLKPVAKVVVTVGTLSFSFRRLFERLRMVLPPGATVLVQAGPEAADISWPEADVRAMVRPDELSRAMRDADIVIAHGGIGSALMAFEAGKSPILVPRRVRFGEHVDDHQEQIARQFARRGLAVAADASELGKSHLEEALSRTVERAAHPVEFGLR
jgi:UDP-N-acetylglucosamine transferase subunit ALG13